jgi:tetratricopeptide (TPR) repeat protein
LAPLGEGAPAGLRVVIQRCLAKEPGQRYQRAGEARAALEAIQSDSGAVSAVRPAARAMEGPRLSTGGRPSQNAEANRYFEAAMLLNFQFDLPRCQKLLRRALEADPHFAEARAWYGFTLEEDPDCARAHGAFAALYLTQGRRELVPGAVEQALRLLPGFPEALHWLAQYHLLGGQSDVAKDLYERVMEQHPLFFPARMCYGEILREEGDIAGALREQERVLEQDPQNMFSLCYAARASMDGGDLAKARAHLDEVRPAERQGCFVRVYAGILAALEGRREEALELVDERVQERLSGNLLTGGEVAAFLAALGEKSKALNWLDRMVRLGDEKAEYFARDPLLANIREHPRFRQILASIEWRRKQRAKP